VVIDAQLLDAQSEFENHCQENKSISHLALSCSSKAILEFRLDSRYDEKKRHVSFNVLFFFSFFSFRLPSYADLISLVRGQWTSNLEVSCWSSLPCWEVPFPVLLLGLCLGGLRWAVGLIFYSLIVFVQYSSGLLSYFNLYTMIVNRKSLFFYFKS